MRFPRNWDYGEPDDPNRGAALGDDVVEVVGDGTLEPSAGDTIHPYSVMGAGDGVEEDEALQSKLPEGEEKGLAPSGVEVGDIEEQRHKRPNVLHGNGLGVQVQESRSLVVQKSSVKGIDRRRQGQHP